MRPVSATVVTPGRCAAAAWDCSSGEGPTLCVVVRVDVNVASDGQMQLVEAAPIVDPPDITALDDSSGLALNGDEWLMVLAEQSAVPLVRSRLPGLVAQARVIVGSETIPVALGIVGLCLDASTKRCTITWRGTKELATMHRACVQAGVVALGASMSWPTVEPPPSSQPEVPTTASATVSVSREALKRAITPFTSATPRTGGGAGPNIPGAPWNGYDAAADVVTPQHETQRATVDIGRDALDAYAPKVVFHDLRELAARPAQGLEAGFACEGLSGGWTAFEVHGFDGCEALSTPHRYAMDVRPVFGSIEPRNLVGKRASLRIPTGSSPAWRYLHGIVHAVEMRDGAPDDVVRVQLESVLTAADRCERCRVFVDQTPEQIVRTVLEMSAWQAADDSLPVTRADSDGVVVAEKRYLFRVAQRPRWTARDARPFCVQYRETDAAFITRLLSEEGLRYHIEDGRHRTLLVISDHDGVGAEPCLVVDDLFETVAHTGFDQGVHSHHEARSRHRGLSAGAVFRDASDTLCVVVRLESHARRRDAARNGSLMLDYTCDITFAGSGMCARVPGASETPAPARVYGSQVAVVVARDDQLAPGRVRVRFAWDERVDNHPTSPWLAVPATRATSDAKVAVPRVGDPVLVTFLNGDPERPVVSAMLDRRGFDGRHGLDR